MNVDRTTFSALLPSLLKHISNSHFIAFDLELSGIPTQRRRDADGKQTVAERYEELKAAAETYHILQVGLTCVEEDVEHQKYVMRAFNFNLSPLVYEGVEFERNFTYSSGAVDFLLQHNYQMNAPFASGIPYLTRPEAELATNQTRMRWDRDAVPDIVIRPDDTQAIEFMKRVRKEIEVWKKLPKSSKADVFSISGQMPLDVLPMEGDVPLNRFEKRLVHQIVRADHTDLQSFGRTSSVQIQKKSKRDIEDEQYQKKSLQRRISRAIFSQVGFRWIAEALAGEHGDLSGIDPGMCSREIAGEEPAATYNAFLQRLNELRTSLKHHKTILIGHNCFLDLIYIYKNFYGPLPDTVEEFQEALHTLFPIIIDTKYVATSGPRGYAFRSAQLGQIHETLSNQIKPTIEFASEHPQYLESESYHQAGFDSFVTAQVFLKLAAGLGAENRSESTTDEMGLDGRNQEVTTQTNNAKENLIMPAETELTPPNQGQESAIPDGKKSSKSKKKSKSSTTNEVFQSKFSSSNNIYDQLANEDDEAISGMAEKPNFSSNVMKSEESNLPRDMAALKISQEQDDTKVQQDNNLIPPFESDLWRIYGNKLRVYGTMEESCDLMQKRKIPSGIDGDKNPENGVRTSPSEDTGERRGSLWEVVRSYIP